MYTAEKRELNLTTDAIFRSCLKLGFVKKATVITEIGFEGRRPM